MSPVVTCPDCGTRVEKGGMEAAVDVAEAHDESMHDGERTSRVDGMRLPSDETVQAAEEFVNRLSDNQDKTEDQDD